MKIVLFQKSYNIIDILYLPTKLSIFNYFLFLILCIPYTSYAVLPDLDEKEIDNIVSHMSLEELLGQTIMLGHRGDNEGLNELISKYSPGSIILFKENFPDENDEKKLRNKIWNLTNTYQENIYNSQPENRKIPLMIAIDQEGGGRMQLKYGVTRTPDPMYIGATRSPDFALQAGQIIGSELRMLGINTVLGPVADINNNDKKDVVGKRSFGAHKDLVAPMAVCFMQGLTSSGVLSIGKHYPGHGDAEQDPHFEMAKVSYEDIQQLENWDLYPFKKLIEFGVNGLMTAHLIVPPLDNQPVTISEKAIKEMRGGESLFNGIVVTDDIANMMGILQHVGPPGDLKGPELNEHYNRQRITIMRRALEAGTDMVMFANIQKVDDAKLPERSVTNSEFNYIFQELKNYFSAGNKKELLRQSVKRIIRQKAKIIPINSFNNQSAWQVPLNEQSFQELRKQHDEIARNITRDAVIQITDNGNFVNKPDDITLFGPKYGPLSQGRLLKNNNDKLLIISPVFKNDTLTSYVKNHSSLWFPENNIHTELLVYGWKRSGLDEAKKHWEDQEIDVYFKQEKTGELQFFENAINQKADQLAKAATGANAVIFGLVTIAQIKILEKFLEKIQTIPVIILLSKEPYFLPADIYKKKNVSVLFAPALPDEELAVDALFGVVQPKTIAYLPFNIPKTIDVRVRDVYLNPETECQLKTYEDYLLEAWQGYNEAKRLVDEAKEKEAMQILHQAIKSAEHAIKFAKQDHESEASRPFLKIDELMLSLMPDAN